MRSSTPSVRASRQVEGSSRSSPRSRAKWLRVPAEMTIIGTSRPAAMPATRAWVPSPPATPSRSAPPSTACRASAATSTIPGPSSRDTWAPSAVALSLSPNFATFPPPDLGFMITNGCRGVAAACSRGLSGKAPLLSAARPAATATTASTTLSATSHNSPATTYTTITNTGAATSTASASQRRMPRLARNHHAAAQAMASPAKPRSSAVMLRRAPDTRSTTTAAAAAANASRASQRWPRLARADVLSAAPASPVPSGPPIGVQSGRLPALSRHRLACHGLPFPHSRRRLHPPRVTPDVCRTAAWALNVCS